MEKSITILLLLLLGKGIAEYYSRLMASICIQDLWRGWWSDQRKEKDKEKGTWGCCCTVHAKQLLCIIQAVRCSDRRPRFYLGTFASELFVVVRVRWNLGRPSDGRSKWCTEPATTATPNKKRKGDEKKDEEVWWGGFFFSFGIFLSFGFLEGGVYFPKIKFLYM